MKKTFFFKAIAITVSALYLFSSCNKEGITKETEEQVVTKMGKSKHLLNDTIIQLDSTKFPKRKTAKTFAKQLKITQNVPFSAYNWDEFTALYQLNNIPFYIRTLNTSLGNTNLTTNGQSQEITLQPYNGNVEQQFYFQFLPASSGIPLLIRSKKEGTPIGAGSYASSPNNYVLFTHGASNSLYGASWDLKFNSDSSAYYIQNQDLLGQGPGGVWDIYNYVLQASNGSIQFSRLNSSLTQQFTIVPVGKYTIGAIDFDYDNGIIQNAQDVSLRTSQVPNYSYDTPDNATLTLQQSTSNTSSFKESSGITRTSSGGANTSFSIPGIFSIGGSITLGESNTTSNEYSTSSTHTISFTETYSFPIPPRTTLKYNWIAKRYKMLIPYRAKCVSEDGTTFFYVSGMYEGVSALETILEREFISMDNPANIFKAPTLRNTNK
ncbi:MAG: hypothetical protein LBJ04_17980 [Sphingobacterium sp.]|jgi:hypothetical protein|nr:hypothetical protein [Sphingobacterium sp.]